MWRQDYFKGESGNGPQTAREAVKQFLHDYVLLEWDIADFPKRVSGNGWNAQIGGEVSDEAGRQHSLSSQQIAVTRLQNSPCLVIFELEEMITEIRREAGLEDSLPAKSQQDQDHGSREEKDDAREAVKDILRLFLDDGTSEEEIMAMVGPAATGNWRIQMGGEIIDRGEPRSLHRQIAAIGPGRLYWAIFDVAEVIAELRREEPRAAEEPAAPAIQGHSYVKCYQLQCSRYHG